MNCPVDGEALQMSERQGVEIDYCPRCRGVWLERGELDKILERASTELAEVGGDRDDYRYRERDDDRYRDDDRERDDDRYRGGYERSEHRPHRRKRSFLSDMFEFGD